LEKGGEKKKGKKKPVCELVQVQTFPKNFCM